MLADGDHRVHAAPPSDDLVLALVDVLREAISRDGELIRELVLDPSRITSPTDGADVERCPDTGRHDVARHHQCRSVGGAFSELAHLAGCGPFGRVPTVDGGRTHSRSCPFPSLPDFSGLTRQPIRTAMACRSRSAP
jgi:hypothetical protein